MPEPSHCPTCGAALASGAEGEVCLACMLEGGLETAGVETTGAPEGDTLPMAAGDGRVSAALSEKAGDWIGPFQLLQPIGEGGFGVVWMAAQLEPISRKVALKVIKAGMDTKEVLARFEAERQALAMMDHPHIATVLDAGATPAGRPWFAMELVRGEPITGFCDREQLDTRHRLELFREVCSAISHAHQKGIIHRDIKPSNVLVSLHDGEPVVKVIDFGIAKALHGPLTEKTLFTRFEQLLGTPQYMSPEQAGKSGLDIDTRSDIYSLGVLLYELLTGKPPFDGKTLVSAGYEEMCRIIREEEPPRPSVKLGTASGEEQTRILSSYGMEPRKLSRQVRGELDWIVMKALEKERVRRYETASAFAADIARYLNHEPVEAGPPSVSYRFGKFARRNRLALGTAGLIALVLVAATGVSTWQAVEANRAREQSEESLYVAHMQVVGNQLKEGRLGGVRDLLNKHLPVPGGMDRRGWEWHYLNSVFHRELNVLQLDSSPVNTLDWNPEGDVLAIGTDLGLIRFWNPLLQSIDGEIQAHDGSVLQVLWNQDGSLLASSGNDGEVKIWRPGIRVPITVCKGAKGVLRALAWARDGRTVFSGGDDWYLRQWDVATGNVLIEKKFQGAIVAIDSHPTLPVLSLATGLSGNRGHHLIDLSDAEWPIRRSNAFDLSVVAWSPDGSLLACGDRGASGHIELLSSDGSKFKRLTHHHSSIGVLDWSPAGRILASSSDDASIQCSDASTGGIKGFMAGHDGAVLSVKWNPKHPVLASAGIDGTVRLWKSNQETFPRNSMRFRGAVTGMAWNPKSSLVAVAAGDTETAIHIVNPDEARSVRLLPSEANFLWDVDWSPDGTRIAAVGGAGITTIWDALSGNVLGVHRGGGICMQVRWSPDSRFVLVVGRSDWHNSGDKADLAIIDGTNGSPLGRFRVSGLERACWSPRENEVITCGQGYLRSWDWRTGRMLSTMMDADQSLACVEWSPDWTRLLVTGRKGLEMILDSKGSVLFSRTGQSDIPGVAWSPDGARYATVAFDGSLGIRNGRTGEEMLNVPAHPGDAFGVSWSPDGRRIATGGFDGMLHLWDAGPGSDSLDARLEILNPVEVAVPHSGVSQPPPKVSDEGGREDQAGPSRDDSEKRPSQNHRSAVTASQKRPGTFASRFLNHSKSPVDSPGYHTDSGVTTTLSRMPRLAISLMNANRIDEAGPLLVRWWLIAGGSLGIKDNEEIVSMVIETFGKHHAPLMETSPPEELLSAYLTNHRDQFSDTSLHLLIISGKKTEKDRAFMESLRNDLGGGQDWAAAAAAHSDDSGAGNGGDRGWVKRGELRDDLWEAAFALDSGQISGVIEDETHFRLVKVTERRDGPSVTLDQVRGAVTEAVRSEVERSRVRGWIEEVRKEQDTEPTGGGSDISAGRGGILDETEYTDSGGVRSGRNTQFESKPVQQKPSINGTAGTKSQRRQGPLIIRDEAPSRKVVPASAAAQEQPITRSWFTPPVVVQGSTEPVRFQATISGKVSSVVLESNRSRRPMFDDGTNGDLKKGDGTWTIQFQPDEILRLNTPARVFRPVVGFCRPAGSNPLNVVGEVWTPEMGLRPVRTVAPDLQETDHIVNFAAGTDDLIKFDPKVWARRFYERYPDDFDFLNFVLVSGARGNRFHFNVRNDISGIGANPMDTGSQYGSRSQLKGINVFPIPSFFDGGAKGFNHETAHQWMNFLHRTPFESGIPHWPKGTIAANVMGFSITGRNSQGGDFPFQFNPDGSGGYRISRIDPAQGERFNLMQLYIMGLAAPEEVGSFLVLKNQQLQVLPERVLSPDDVVEVTVQDVIKVAGPRVPDHTRAQKSFRSAVIVLSEGLLDAHAMSFYDYFARRAEAKEVLPYSSGMAAGTSHPWYLATGGRSEMTTRIRPER